MKRFGILLAATGVALGAAGGVSGAPEFYEPYFGFVQVPGELGSDDTGADPRILANALKYSDATCIRGGAEEMEVIELGDRLGVGYAVHGSSREALEKFSENGYFHLIFENEPDGTAGTNPNWAEDYMRRLNAMYPIIKEVDPRFQIIGGNLLSPNFHRLYEHGFKEVSEVIGFHNYSNDPRTGINMDAIKPIRDEMMEADDEHKKIFLGEGWGPTRELPGLKRLFPDAPMPAEEVQMLRDFVVNGYWSIVTPKPNYDPNWILGVLFFTLNDNWGGQQWAPRAQPKFDDQGNVMTYIVDGYDVGMDIWPHFYNGGLLDIMGNAKDNLMDVFPGRGLALGNSGFEYALLGDTEVGADWTAAGGSREGLALDRSIRHGGQVSQRITAGPGGSRSIHQDSVRGSVESGKTYQASAWVRSYNLPQDGMAGISVQFLNASGNLIGTASTAAVLRGTKDWTLLRANGQAPEGADRLRVVLTVQGDSGTAWFDDAIAWEGSADETSTLNGYVLNEQRQPVPGAMVQALDHPEKTAETDEKGFFQITGVRPGVHNITAGKDGFTARTAESQLALPGKVRPLGFSLPQSSENLATGIRVEDEGVGGILKLGWTAPTDDYDFLRIYRSGDPGQLGEVAFDNVMEGPVWDTGLADGTRYSYTIRTVRNGEETDNNNHAYGIPSGGMTVAAYSGYPAAQWGHFGGSFGQSFVAKVDGYVASASAMPGFGESHQGADLTFTILDAPDGEPIGPSRTAAAAGNAETIVTWPTGAIPVEKGKTYYLRVTGSREFAAYRGDDLYAEGTFFIDDEPVPESDMWSTIKLVEPKPVDIQDVSVSAASGGGVAIAWATSAPATSQVEYRTNGGEWVATDVDDQLVEYHRVVLPDLTAGTSYEFRVRSTREDVPDGASLSYYFAPEAE